MIFLLIAVPPSIPVIYNERGEPIESSRAGPYEEGGELNLMCVVMGGKLLNFKVIATLGIENFIS